MQYEPSNQASSWIHHKLGHTSAQLAFSLSLSVVKLVIIFSLSNHHTPQDYCKKMHLPSLTKPRGVLDDNVVVSSGKNKETEREVKLCYYQHPSLVDYEIHDQHQ
jgi:hypothetical protein